MGDQAGTTPPSRQEREAATQISTAPPGTTGLSSLPSPWAPYTRQPSLQPQPETWVLTWLGFPGRGHVAPDRPHRVGPCTRPVWAG